MCAFKNYDVGTNYISNETLLHLRKTFLKDWKSINVFDDYNSRSSISIFLDKFSRKYF